MAAPTTVNLTIWPPFSPCIPHHRRSMQGDRGVDVGHHWRPTQLGTGALSKGGSSHAVWPFSGVKRSMKREIEEGLMIRVL
ncbi:hypothetical protein E3N88_06527 [Mikania micrantha]|uniref:Uncharacterized protein n=1 Tax=Mikania micrantha TaxID=192012 RepID=A0A5N6PPR0_9ASTR|nr:hypothetical protein E3N88_06527 [Mikania micrantha]